VTGIKLRFFFANCPPYYAICSLVYCTLILKWD